jgi:hypothetical protein
MSWLSSRSVTFMPQICRLTLHIRNTVPFAQNIYIIHAVALPAVLNFSQCFGNTCPYNFFILSCWWLPRFVGLKPETSMRIASGSDAVILMGSRSRGDLMPLTPWQGPGVPIRSTASILRGSPQNLTLLEKPFATHWEERGSGKLFGSRVHSVQKHRRRKELIPLFCRKACWDTCANILQRKPQALTSDGLSNTCAHTLLQLLVQCTLVVHSTKKALKFLFWRKAAISFHFSLLRVNEARVRRRTNYA